MDFITLVQLLFTRFEDMETWYCIAAQRLEYPLSTFISSLYRGMVRGYPWRLKEGKGGDPINWNSWSWAKLELN